VELPAKAYFSGNDIYQWCQHDKLTAQAYVAGMYDMAVHSAFWLDNIRNTRLWPRACTAKGVLQQIRGVELTSADHPAALPLESKLGFWFTSLVSAYLRR
jgi:hypothetical protein